MSGKFDWHRAINRTYALTGIVMAITAANEFGQKGAIPTGLNSLHLSMILAIPLVLWFVYSGFQKD